MSIPNAMNILFGIFEHPFPESDIEIQLRKVDC